eukprot:CAMPEP_0119353952 /NCGR_PEP_ID=MMETSP1334-20130426/3037_1 /TAXON_ID=127549 /ORGANISM="Calcidiscus leptoporus, Strain RCC1130" /LENGTH=125 /DNA_ID=CAMNT_0007367377 /DNA_START=68 /DNA_END=445 /DNA_ORIENTATION=-
MFAPCDNNVTATPTRSSSGSHPRHKMGRLRNGLAQEGGARGPPVPSLPLLFFLHHRCIAKRLVVEKRVCLCLPNWTMRALRGRVWLRDVDSKHSSKKLRSIHVVDCIGSITALVELHEPEAPVLL